MRNQAGKLKRAVAVGVWLSILARVFMPHDIIKRMGAASLPASRNAMIVTGSAISVSFINALFN